MKLRSSMVAFASLVVGATGCASISAPPSGGSASPEKPPARSFRADEIMNQKGAALDALLGAPALTRREGEGEYRRYSLSECALIVILYPDEKGAERVRHIDAAALVNDGRAPVLADCLAKG